METLLEKAKRLGIQPQGQITTPPLVESSVSIPQTESLLQKAQRLGIKPVQQTSIIEKPINQVESAKSALLPSTPNVGEKGALSTALDTSKMAVNFGKGIFDLIKDMSYGTLKRLGYDIPVETFNLIKESGGVIPAAKNLYGTVTNKTPFQPLQNYITPNETSNPVTESIKGFVPEVVREAVRSDIPNETLADRAERMRQSLINEPLSAILGAKIIEKPLSFIDETSKGIKKTGDFLKSPVSNLKEVTPEVKNIYSNTQQKAVNDLESTYEEIMSGTTPGKKKLGKINIKTENLNKAGTEGRTPMRVLAEEGIIPKRDGTKLDTMSQASSYREKIKPLKEVNIQALQEAGLSSVPIDLLELEKRAIQYAKTPENINSGRFDKMEADIKTEFSTLKKHYPSGKIPLTIVDNIKTARWDNVFKNKGLIEADLLKKDSEYSIAKALQKVIEETVTEAGNPEVAQLNREIGDRLEAAKFLEDLNGKTIKGGRLLKYVTTAIGSSMGQSIYGKIIGAIGGNIVGELIIAYNVSGPIKRLLLRNLELKDPLAYTKTIEWLKKQDLDKNTRLLLQEAPMIVPEKSSQTITEAQKMSNNFFQNLKINQNTLKLPPGETPIITPNIQGTPNPRVQQFYGKGGDLGGLQQRIKPTIENQSKSPTNLQTPQAITNDINSPIDKYPKNPNIGLQIEDVSKTLPQTTKNVKNSLAQEAKKYKSGKDFYELSGSKVNQMLRDNGIRGQEQTTKYWEEITGKKSNPNYGMSHRPSETGATASDITQNVSESGLPKDFYQHPEYYADMSNKSYQESFSALKKIKGKPETEVTIYRASPKNELNKGDWVTLSKNYAKGESLSENTTVHSFKVKAKDIQFAGDDINEFGYYPEGKTTQESQLTDIWNEANTKNPLGKLTGKKTKPILEFKQLKMTPERENAIISVITDLETSVPGARGIHPIKSTFPQWIPEHLRSNKLFSEVKQYLGTDRTPTKKDELELYEILMDRIRYLDKEYSKESLKAKELLNNNEEIAF